MQFKKILTGVAVVCSVAAFLLPILPAWGAERSSRELRQLEKRVDRLEKNQKSKSRNKIKESGKNANEKVQYPHEITPNIGEYARLDGKLEFNYMYQSWDKGDNQGGHLEFYSFQLNPKAYKDRIFLDASIWIKKHNTFPLNHGVIGYDISPNSSIKFGAPVQPFGILPYPQNGWSFHIPFFLGYGHNAALGGLYKFEGEKWAFQAGFFKQPLSFKRRWAPNLVDADNVSDKYIGGNGAQHNEKENQLNVRLDRKFSAGSIKQKLGFSGEGGMLHNTKTNEDGTYWSAELRSKTNYGPWELDLQGIRYEYHPKNRNGVSKDTVLFGADGSPAYLVAAKGTVGVANLSYTLNTPKLGPIKRIKFFNDFSHLFKDKESFNDSTMETIGAQWLAPPLILWTDFAWARNSIYGGRPAGVGLGPADDPDSNQWDFRGTVHVSFIF